MIRNNNQVKGKYKARIYKGEKYQINFKEALKGGILTAGAIYRCSIAILGKDIWEYNKYKQKQQDDKQLIVLRKTAKIVRSVFKLTMT